MSQQEDYSNKFPAMVFHNEGLLHAMLAISSLHIAKLQGSSVYLSYKHYHLAMRRVSRSVRSPTKRRDLATLAATLLLGFYEVMAAEHNKWNSHLLGAKQLVMDIDFEDMTRYI